MGVEAPTNRPNPTTKLSFGDPAYSINSRVIPQYVQLEVLSVVVGLNIFQHFHYLDSHPNLPAKFVCQMFDQLLFQYIEVRLNHKQDGPHIFDKHHNPYFHPELMKPP